MISDNSSNPTNIAAELAPFAFASHSKSGIEGTESNNLNGACAYTKYKTLSDLRIKNTIEKTIDTFKTNERTKNTTDTESSSALNRTKDCISL
jgi:hypothetical protein